jgi:hypothetical protein
MAKNRSCEWARAPTAAAAFVLPRMAPPSYCREWRRLRTARLACDIDMWLRRGSSDIWMRLARAVRQSPGSALLPPAMAMRIKLA